MEFDPELWLRVRDKRVTAQQMRILSELAITHSQTQAALNLGISVPVLHRHLRSLGSKMGTDLISTTPNGTWVTNEGMTLLKVYNRFNEMLKQEESVTLYCTPITQNMLIEVIREFELTGEKYNISVNSDQKNLKALFLGRADLVLFDDPFYAIEFEGISDEKILTEDIFTDTLIHINNGEEYIRYKYGAQRLGYRYLDNESIDYTILFEISDYNYILNSGKSYFINQSLIHRKKIEIPDQDDNSMFKHPIIAVSINPDKKIRDLVNRLRQTGY